MTFWIRYNLGIVSADEAREPDATILDVRDLYDGANPPEVITPKILAGAELLRQGVRVIVQCQGGISRSPATAAAIIAYMDCLDFDDALYEVQRKVRRAMPEMSLRDSMKTALKKLREVTVHE